MASKSLTFELYGKDRTASAAMRGVSNEADRMGQAMRRVGIAAVAGLAVATGAAIAFGISSVKAFADAQAQQERLNFAYEKFPAIADVTRASYDALNTALATKTGYDDDAIASGQAVLAQFGLTGKQLQTLTPLLLDYARASGQDVVGAAEDVGKAMLGQGRALKGIGIDFKDAGSVAANFDQVMAGLTTNVAGYAEQFGTTAAGKFEILTMKWGEFQEKVGSALLPGLEKLMVFAESDVMPALQGFAEWFATDGVVGIGHFIDALAWINENQAISVAALSALAAGFAAISVAMDANPIGAFIALLAASIVWYTYWASVVNTKSNEIIGAIQTVEVAFQVVLANIAVGINNFLAPLNALISGINALTGMNIGRIGISVPSINVGGPVSVAPTSTSRAASGGNKVGMKAFADGGIVKGGRGGVLGLIGEKNYDEMVVPLKPGQNFGGGTTVVVNFNGTVVGNNDSAAKDIIRVVTDAVKRGQVPRGALA